MPAVSGVDFTLSAAANILAGQRGVTLDLSMDVIDVTCRDSDWWMTHLAGLRSWSISFDALYLEDDAAEQAIEDAYFDHTSLAIILTTPAGNTYSGTCFLTSYSFEGPYSAESTASGTLQGSGELVTTAS
jgi:TP901-1 family phage major tail protein